MFVTNQQLLLFLVDRKTVHLLHLILNHLRTTSCTFTSAEWHGWAQARTGMSCASALPWVPRSVPGAEERGELCVNTASPFFTVAPSSIVCTRHKLSDRSPLCVPGLKAVVHPLVLDVTIETGIVARATVCLSRFF